MNIEDSLGAQWFEIKDLKQEMLSPFVFYVISEIENK